MNLRTETRRPPARMACPLAIAAQVEDMGKTKRIKLAEVFVACLEMLA